jgi:hypothetical protein
VYLILYDHGALDFIPILRNAGPERVFRTRGLGPYWLAETMSAAIEAVDWKESAYELYARYKKDLEECRGAQEFSRGCEEVAVAKSTIGTLSEEHGRRAR